MTLLSLQSVRKGYPDRQDGHPVLRDATLEVETGELVVVWGMRRSGRSTLLRVAAGIEPPDAGVVRFGGLDLAEHGERLIGQEIGYVQRTLRFTDGQTALEHAMVGLLSRWTPPTRARARARAALERVGAAHCAGMHQRELSSAEALRVALARTLVLEPRLLVVDEPVKGIDLIDRDPILALLRSLADEGIAVLASTGESTGLSEADRAFVLGGGELRGAPASSLAPVIPLRRASEQASG